MNIQLGRKWDCSDGHTTEHFRKHLFIVHDGEKTLGEVPAMDEEDLEELLSNLENGECPICDRWGSYQNAD